MKDVLNLILDDISPFCGLLIPLFWTSHEVCPGFLSQSRFPCLHPLSPACQRFLIFTSGVTPANLLVTSISPMYLCTSIDEAGVQDEVYHCLIACDKTDALPTELPRLGFYNGRCLMYWIHDYEHKFYFRT